MKRIGLPALAIGIVAAALTSFWLGTRSADRRPLPPKMVTAIVSNQDIPASVNLSSLIREGGVFRPVQVPVDVLVPGAVVQISQLRNKVTGSPILANEQIPLVRISSEGTCLPREKATVWYEGKPYVRLDNEFATAVPFVRKATLPAQAMPAGVRHSGLAVWALPQVGPPSSVYVKYPTHVERWPMFAGVCN